MLAASARTAPKGETARRSKVPATSSVRTLVDGVISSDWRTWRITRPATTNP